MVDKTRKNLFTVSGVLLLIFILNFFVNFISVLTAGLETGFTFSTGIYYAALIFTALVMLIKPSGKLVGAAFCALAAAMLFSAKIGFAACFNCVMFSAFAVAAFLGEKREISGFAPVLYLLPPIGLFIVLAVNTASAFEYMTFMGINSAIPNFVIYTIAWIAAGSAIVNLPRSEKREKAHTAGCIGCVILIFFALVIRVIAYFNIPENFLAFDGAAAVYAVLYGLLLIGAFMAPAAFMFKGKEKPEGEKTEGYLGLIKLVLLSVFTFGIYNIYWLYRTTRFLNSAPGGNKYSPVGQTLLCIFVPFYIWYWFYRHGEKADVLSGEYSLNFSGTAVLCLVLAILLNVVAPIILQDRINNICVAAVKASNTQDAREA